VVYESYKKLVNVSFVQRLILKKLDILFTKFFNETILSNVGQHR